MKNVTKLLVLAGSCLLLASCGGSADSSKNNTSKSDSTSKWSDSQKALLTRYCGEVLPYPDGFEGDIGLDVVYDEATETDFLQITSVSEEFTIADYYLDLEDYSWNGICDYEGNIEQHDSNGNPYYELIKTSKDDKIGYDLTYFFYEDTTTTESVKYNVIQCYNDFDAELDPKSDWSESEKDSFSSTLTEDVPLLKLGKRNAVRTNGSDFVYCYDMLAKDTSKDNIEILKKAGYALDEEKSASYGSYVLKKELSDGAIIYASLYYYSGNYITFSYNAKISTSASWPQEVVASFEAKTGFSIPSFVADDIKEYVSYTKNGVTTIYAYTEEFYVGSMFQMAMAETNAVYDTDKSWYSDWGETFFIKPQDSHDSYGNSYFAISFGLLESPYNTFETGWPSSSLSNFLKENNINVALPTLDFTSYSPYSTCRTSAVNYSDVYSSCLAAVKANPSDYVSDATDEVAIEEASKKLAKSQTAYKIKIYDPSTYVDPSDSESKTTYKVYEYLLSSLRKTGWCRIESYNYDVAYEDPNGNVMVGLNLSNGVSIITITYGSGETHQPVFQFDASNFNVAPGDSYNLSYTVNMLPYDIAFTSDNDKVTVNDEGCVHVDSSAEAGTVATITATMDVPNEGKRTISCTVTVSDSYDFEKAINKVADAYNSYYSIDKDSSSVAKPELIDKSNPDEGYTFKYYALILNLTSIATTAEAKSFVLNNLIPAGFEEHNDGKWGKGTYEDGTVFESIDYYWYDSNYDGVELTYAVYQNSDGSISVRVASFSI